MSVFKRFNESVACGEAAGKIGNDYASSELVITRFKQNRISHF